MILRYHYIIQLFYYHIILSYYILTFLNYYYSLIFSDFHWIHSSMRANRGEIQEKPRTRRRTKGTHNFRNFRELFVNMSTNSFGLSTLATIDDMLPHFVQIFGRMLPNVATFWQLTQLRSSMCPRSRKTRGGGRTSAPVLYRSMPLAAAGFAFD